MRTGRPAASAARTNLKEDSYTHPGQHWPEQIRRSVGGAGASPEIGPELKVASEFSDEAHGGAGDSTTSDSDEDSCSLLSPPAARPGRACRRGVMHALGQRNPERRAAPARKQTLARPHAHPPRRIRNTHTRIHPFPSLAASASVIPPARAHLRLQLRSRVIPHMLVGG